MAMSGTVDASGLRAWIDLSVWGERDQSIEVRAAVDTGSTGDLTLPAEILQQLDLPLRETRIAQLADGRQTEVQLYAGRVVWHGSLLRVLVLGAQEGANPLLGMGLMLGSRLTLDAAPGAEVLIEER